MLNARSLKISLLGLAALLCCLPAQAQSGDSAGGPVVNLADGPVNVTIQHLDAGNGPDQDASANAGAATTTGLPHFLSFYPAFDGSVTLPFNIVGADPSLGASTTVIPTVIIPLRIVFPGSGSPTLDGSNVVAAVLSSPIFQNAQYNAGPVDLGFTQYGDALQRAEFWNLPGFSTDYHVLLGTPIVNPTVTITVPAGLGNVYALSGGGSEGVVDDSYFETAVRNLALSYPATQLPIFLTDNVFLGANGLLANCCTYGYHNSQGPPAATARTWIYSAYIEPGTFAGSQLGAAPVDVMPLSHEVAEWLNDPYVGSFTFGFLNIIPPAVLPQGGCIENFETGDPLEGRPYLFSKITSGTTYHLQDEVVLPWYLHSTTGSFSANGWYTFQNLSAQVPLVTNSPASIAGSNPNTSTVGWAPVGAGVTGDVVYIGRGCPAGSVSAGSPADPYLADPTGKIALIDRGVCGVSLKVDAAVQAGAKGVLIGLVAPGSPITFSYAGGTNFAPTLVITQTASNALKAALASSRVNATISLNNAIPAPPSTLCTAGQ